MDDFEGDFLEAEVFHTAFVCLVEHGSTCIVCNIFLERPPSVAVLVPALSSIAVRSKALTPCLGRVI